MSYNQHKKSKGSQERQGYNMGSLEELIISSNLSICGNLKGALMYILGRRWRLQISWGHVPPAREAALES